MAFAPAKAQVDKEGRMLEVWEEGERGNKNAMRGKLSSQQSMSSNFRDCNVGKG